MRCFAWLLSFVLAAFAVACGKDEALQAGRDSPLGHDLQGAAGAPEPAPLEPPDCAQLAVEACEGFAACSPLQLFYAFDSRSACEAQLEAACFAFTAEGRYIDQAGCSAALAAPRCSAFHGAKLPSSCAVPRGPQEDGQPCFSDADCDSTYCDRKDACGTCASRRAQGENCQQAAQCLPGLVCAEGGCTPPAEPGSRCDESQPCGGNLLCVGGECREPIANGERCTMEMCDSFAGSACDRETSRCSPSDLASLRECNPDPELDSGLPPCLTVALIGEACGSDDECGKLAFCEDGVCSIVTRRCR